MGDHRLCTLLTGLMVKCVLERSTLDLPWINGVFWFWEWITGLPWSVLMGVGLDVGVDNWSGSTFDSDPSYLWMRKWIGSNQAGTSNVRFSCFVDARDVHELPTICTWNGPRCCGRASDRLCPLRRVEHHHHHHGRHT